MAANNFPVFSTITIIISIINIINTMTIIRQKKVIYFIYSQSAIATLIRLGYVAEDEKNKRRLFLFTWRATETE